MSKFAIYQVLIRSFGNSNTQPIVNGTIQENGCGKLNDFTNNATGTIQVGGDFENDWNETFTSSGVVNVSGDLLNGGTLTNSSGGRLTVNGEFENDWSKTFSNAGYFSVEDFLNNGSITNTDSFCISGVLDNSNNKTITNNGTFVFETTATTSAYVIDNGHISGTGNTTIELYLSGGKWHYVSIPLSGVSSNVFMGAALYSYNESTNTWNAHGSGETLQQFVGYDVYFADNTKVNYTSLGVTLADSNGYSKTLAQIARGFLPTSIGGSSSTYITDYYEQNTGWRVAELSGSAFSNTKAGIACWTLTISSGDTYRNVGGRLSR